MNEKVLQQIDSNIVIGFINEAINGTEVHLIFDDKELYELLKKNYKFLNYLLSDSNGLSKDALDNEYLKKLYILLRKIYLISSKLELYMDYYYKSRIEGLSLISMYENCNKTHVNNKHLLLTKKLSDILNLEDYSWIKNYITYTNVDEKIISYIKYKKCRKRNKFNTFNLDLSEDVINQTLSKLDSLLNNKYSLKPPIYVNEYSDDFFNLQLPLDISDSELTDYIKIINLKHNCKYLLRCTKIKWYHYLSPIKMKKIKTMNKSLLEKYSALETSILMEYKENLQFIKFFLNSFDFLQPIVNYNVFDRIETYIYDEQQLYNYLNEIKKDLILYKEFIKLKKTFDNLKEKELEILSFCNENSATVADFKNILHCLPNMILYNYLETNLNDEKDFSVNFDTELTKLHQYKCLIEELSSIDYSLESNSVFNNKNNITNYIIKSIKVDNTVKILNYMDYINKSIDTTNKKNIYKENILVRELLYKIRSLGYKISFNYIYNSVPLDIIVHLKDNLDIFSYLSLDFTINNTNDYILKILLLKENNIPIIYYKSEEFFTDSQNAFIFIKDQLQKIFH